VRVLVDTSAWIHYLRGGRRSEGLDVLIDEDLIVINELVLSELIPALTVQGQIKLIALLRLLPIQPLSIDWDEIQSIQTRCMKKGFNGIGIPDLIVAQNALQHHLPLYTFDKHFRWLADIAALKLFS